MVFRAISRLVTLGARPRDAADGPAILAAQVDDGAVDVGQTKAAAYLDSFTIADISEYVGGVGGGHKGSMQPLRDRAGGDSHCGGNPDGRHTAGAQCQHFSVIDGGG